MHPQIKRKLFWGGKLWTQSYIVETIGNANKKVIRENVRNQLEAVNKGEENTKQLGLFKKLGRLRPSFLYVLAQT